MKGAAENVLSVTSFLNLGSVGLPLDDGMMLIR